MHPPPFLPSRHTGAASADAEAAPAHSETSPAEIATSGVDEGAGTTERDAEPARVGAEPSLAAESAPAGDVEPTATHDATATVAPDDRSSVPATEQAELLDSSAAGSPAGGSQNQAAALLRRLADRIDAGALVIPAVPHGRSEAALLTVILAALLNAEAAASTSGTAATSSGGA